MEMDDQRHATSQPFTPMKETRYAFYSSLGGPQGRSGRLRKASSPTAFDPQTVQPVASSYPALRRTLLLLQISPYRCTVYSTIPFSSVH